MNLIIDVTIINWVLFFSNSVAGLQFGVLNLAVLLILMVFTAVCKEIKT
jgi:hypothetical protein